MLGQHHLLQTSVPRIIAAVERVRQQIWTKVQDIPVEFGGMSYEHTGFEEGAKRKFQPVELPYIWGTLCAQGWFRIKLPANTEGLYLTWEEQGEATLYIKGVPYYGFDAAHRFCKLPKGEREVFVESLCMQAGIWVASAKGLDPKGSKVSEVALYRRNDLAWEVYYDLEVLLNLLFEEARRNNPIEQPKRNGTGYQYPVAVVSVLYRRLLRALDDAVSALDTGGLPAIKAKLKQTYQSLAGRSDRIRAILTGHAHIDLVWLWTERAGESKAVHTFSITNRLMDLYPELVFGYSQPASYEAVQRRSPALMKEVAKRIKQGRWEPAGATYVESDTILACGEGLARSFIVGQQGYTKLQGKPSRVLWIPDVFGYSGCLPQIMRQTGVDFFFTTKLTWSTINRFPYSSFIWRGIDGTDVLVHVSQELGYNQGATVAEVKTGAAAYRQSDVHDAFLAPTGVGDGGGGVTEEMLERARRMKDLESVPQTGWGRIDTFFEELDRLRGQLPVYQGELYLEYHRGTFTTHGDLKAAFRGCERALQVWEAARCATGGKPVPEHPWKRLIFGQFHDYIPGSSIREVYQEALPELAAITNDAHANARKDLGEKGEASLFNPLPIPTLALVGSGKAKRLVKLAPLSGRPISQLESVEAVKAVEATKNSLKSAQVEARFDESGRITKLSFASREIAISAPLNELYTYPDFPHMYSAWEIDRQTLSLGQVEKSKATCTVEQGELEATVSFTRKLARGSSITTRYRVDAAQALLHIEYEIDWHEEMALLKAVFPTKYNGAVARFGAPYGSVLRPQQAGDLRGEAMFETCASRYGIVVDDGEVEGLALVTEAKYGFSCQSGVIGISLVKAARITGEDDAAHFPPAIRPAYDGSSYSDQGKHIIRLALAPHGPHVARENLAPALADRLYTPPIAYTGGVVSAGLLGFEGGDSLHACWAKPAEDGNGWILRLTETMGRRGSCLLKLGQGWSAEGVDLLENAAPGVAASAGGASVEFVPYQLISVRISKPKPAKAALSRTRKK